MNVIFRIISSLFRRRKYVFALSGVTELIQLYLARYEMRVGLEDVLHKLNNLYGNIQEILKIGFDKIVVLEEADNYLNDTYILFGSSGAHLSVDKWSQDFKTNYIWPKGKAYFRYKTINYATHSDVKFPWDMSRSHHLLILGQSYRITKDEKYAGKIRSDIIDFITANPFMHSINWTCTMDVAIRAANWIYALAIITESDVMKDHVFLRRLIKSLYEHKFYIEHNLEKYKPYSGNHYVADLAGLLHIYIFLNVKGDKFQNAVDEFQNEIREQVLPSGFHFEKSTSYHKLVLEMVLYTYFLLRNNFVYINLDVTEKIKDMVRFLATIKQPDGNIPFIADNDNGRFLPFVTKGYADASQLINVASMIFSEESFSSSLKTVYYDDAKLAVMRNRTMFATIHNNPISKYYKGRSNILYGTHTHCDMLSFTFSDGINNLIVDPGTFCYTSSPESRIKYKSTTMHNTVCVDGLDQQKQNMENLFTVTQYSFPTISEMKEDNVYLGEYEYCDHGKLVYKHKRIFEINNDGCKLCDTVETNTIREVRAYLHLCPSLEVHVKDNVAQIVDGSRLYEIMVVSDARFSMFVSLGQIAESYGYMLNAPVITIDFGKYQGELKFETLIHKLK